MRARGKCESGKCGKGVMVRCCVIPGIMGSQGQVTSGIMGSQGQVKQERDGSHG